MAHPVSFHGFSMSNRVPTVRIHLPHESGEFAIINESDLQPDHVLFDSLPAIVEPIQEEQVPAPRPRGRPRKVAQE